MITTWKYRIKDSGKSGRSLRKMARSVNFVWNFAKQTQLNAYRAKSARLINDKKSGALIAIPNALSAFELNNLVAGSSKDWGCILKVFRLSQRSFRADVSSFQSYPVGEAKGLLAGCLGKQAG